MSLALMLLQAAVAVLEHQAEDQPQMAAVLDQRATPHQPWTLPPTKVAVVVVQATQPNYAARAAQES
jgi:hypothetical protein